MSAANDLTKRLIKAIPREFEGSRVWRRNVGGGYPVAPVKAAIRARSWEMLQRIRTMTFGMPGEPDIDGWLKVKGLAIKLGVEVKVGDDVQSEEQIVAQRVYGETGAIYVLARDFDETMAQIAKIHRELGMLIL